MHKTKIEWTDYSWNPIKGICPVGCWYCYGRAIYKRFKLDPKIRWNLTENKEIDRLMRINPPKGSKIFVCSTFELFHPKVAKSWRKTIFEIIKTNPQYTFQILTKMPENIDRPMPDNVWLGVSITGNFTRDFRRACTFGLEKRKAKIQFVSYEPLFEEPVLGIPNVDWVIIGRLTGHGHKHDPKREWIESIIKTYVLKNIPIFLKDNLKDIWGEPLIQEFPK